MAFWQEWMCARCEGDARPLPATAAEGWPAVEPGSWPTWRDRFVHGLERAASLGAEASALDRPVTPAIEFPPLAHLTIGATIVHIATHNAHHLGQVILLRQLLGAWPPPAGSYTW